MKWWLDASNRKFKISCIDFSFHSQPVLPLPSYVTCYCWKAIVVSYKWVMCSSQCNSEYNILHVVLFAVVCMFYVWLNSAWRLIPFGGCVDSVVVGFTLCLNIFLINSSLPTSNIYNYPIVCGCVLVNWIYDGLWINWNYIITEHGVVVIQY